jgi:hypothetical protein
MGDSFELDIHLFAVELNVVLLQDLIGTLFSLESNETESSRSLFILIIHHFKLFNLQIGERVAC